MRYVIFITILIVSWLIGVFGWAQIVGGFQSLKSRGVKMLITVLIWSVIVIGTFIVVLKFYPTSIIAWIIGMVVSLVQVLRQEKIE